MTKFFFKFKKLYFWPISPILGRAKSFPKKSGSAMYNLIKVYVNLYQHAENQSISLICSKDIAD